LPLPAALWLNSGRGTFREATSAAGAGLLLPGSSVAAGDLDGDGDLDLAIQTGGALAEHQERNLVLENRRPSGVPPLP
jgi:hypothetical protein